MDTSFLLNTSVALCGFDDISLRACTSFLSSKNTSICTWSPNICALIVGSDYETKWKYTTAVRKNIRIVHATDILPAVESDLWVTTYAPKKLSDLIGLAEPVHSLSTWLKAWVQDMTTPRGALLTGPPGIGKTTLAHLVARACGYDIVELNASNERSASAVRRWFEEAARAQCVGRRRVVIMDEVDGMSRGDRGGIGELARVIRTCSFPMICIANERTVPRMRPLVSCCIDIRCARPVKSTIAKRLMTTVVKDRGLTVTQGQLEDICERNGNDIRQILNGLQFMMGSGGSTKDERLRIDPFSATGRLFGRGGTLDDRSNLVFIDIGLIPLMVAEGYVAAAGKGKGSDEEKLERCASAGAMLGNYDILDHRIHTGMNWGLLPSAVMSILNTATTVAGPAPFQIFPSWLGKNSKRLKHKRMMTALRHHGQFGSDSAALDMRPLLRARLFRGTDAKSIVDELMSLGLTRDDMMETLVETMFSDDTGCMMDTKTKGAITREWKKRVDNEEPVKYDSDVEYDSDSDVDVEDI